MFNDCWLISSIKKLWMINVIIMFMKNPKKKEWCRHQGITMYLFSSLTLFAKFLAINLKSGWNIIWNDTISHNYEIMELKDADVEVLIVQFTVVFIYFVFWDDKYVQ